MPVSFTRMVDGTADDYALIDRTEAAYAAGTADRVLDQLRLLDEGVSGYQISRLGHSLQTATRAHRDGADVDLVVTALLHDIGDVLALHNHGEVAAAILAPFVRDECVWIARHHGVFQMAYYAHHLGGDPDARARHAGHPHFDACARFCHDWDQASFDPAYDTLPLSFFEPLVREVFARTPWAAR